MRLGGDAPMAPVQWLIDLLINFRNEGAVVQIGFVVAILTAVIGAIAGIRRYFRRGYHQIEEENAALEKNVQSKADTIAKLRREISNHRDTIDRLQSQIQSKVPSEVLERANSERMEGNEEIAINILTDILRDLSPSVAECCVWLCEHHMSLCIDESTQGYLQSAERYARLASLLDPSRKDAKITLAEIEAKEAGDATKENYKKLGITWVSYLGERMEYKGKDKIAHYRLIFSFPTTRTRSVGI